MGCAEDEPAVRRWRGVEKGEGPRSWLSARSTKLLAPDWAVACHRSTGPGRGTMRQRSLVANDPTSGDAADRRDRPPKSVPPLAEAVKALPHRPVYRMHRYFARRPYSVFAELVRHYSRPGDLILDPFCGGGVTLVEGVLQGRRVAGFDLNPIAVNVTRMELGDVDLAGLARAHAAVMKRFWARQRRLFSTTCRGCHDQADVLWFEVSSLAPCSACGKAFHVSAAGKAGVGAWYCPGCKTRVRFSPQHDTASEVMSVLYRCGRCGERLDEASAEDRALAVTLAAVLADAERQGLWIPDAAIPDCNMQRESALFSKGIVQFRQLFTPRLLLALAELKAAIVETPEVHRPWLLFAFSATLRYANRMVTRNPGWRGNRPLEWAKPGFWLPPVFLETNVAEEFDRRFKALLRGKRDYLANLPGAPPAECAEPGALLKSDAPAYHVARSSSTKLPLRPHCVDVIITDPPYGSNVHYADLSNFWAVWLPELGMGRVIDDREEAVIARKRFPGAKSAQDYQVLLERCFGECSRVLKPGGYMVMTFNNREPRAWGSLLVAAAKAGFDLPPGGVVFQSGIETYRHTAQSRRNGSVIGDFILSFKADGTRLQKARRDSALTTEEVTRAITKVLRREGRPLSPNELLQRLYVDLQPRMMERARGAIARGDRAINELIESLDDIRLLDSHRRQLLEKHFNYRDGNWALRDEHAPD